MVEGFLGEIVAADIIEEEKRFGLMRLIQTPYHGYASTAWRAEDLGYREPPMTYWFKIPGSTDSEEFLPIRDDKEVNEMLAFIQTSKVLQLYIVGGGVRKKRKQSLRIKEGIIRNQFTMPSTLVM